MRAFRRTSRSSPEGLAHTACRGANESIRRGTSLGTAFPGLLAQSIHASPRVVQQRSFFDRLASGSAVQLKKGGRDEGTFVGDRAAIHLHIDIGNPHLMIGGDRYDIGGRDFGGVYGRARCAAALDALTESDRSGVSGAVACRDWLADLLDGEMIPNPGGAPSSAVECQWGQGLIFGYPARRFQK